LRLLTLSVVLAAAIVGGTVQAQHADGVFGDLSVDGAIHLRDFSLRPGAVLEVPEQLRFQRGGVSDPLPPSGGRTRAQPGGNFEIQPLGDYFRAALDIYPTQGKKPDTDALAELTIHRIHPSNDGHEMLSVSGLADSQNRFGVIVEAHGSGRVKPLDFQMIQGGLLAVDKDIKPFDAIAMRMRTDGTMQFGAVRHGGDPGPVDAISLERDRPGNVGDYPSDYIRLTGKRVKGRVAASDWRTNVALAGSQGSALCIANREADKDYEKKLQITSNGDLELPTPGGGLILTSPNGKKWRLGVTDGGDFDIAPLTN
jgi:hypothetical protein